MSERERPVDVTVRAQSAADKLRSSAEAVQVLEIEDEQRSSADLGEVLSRASGVGVRRPGGLGTAAEFSLNGLRDDQVRFFIDGTPFEFAGLGFGIANVPVNLVERIEVYRGVVPIRFGADALGGAVNLVSQASERGTHAGASYEAGSFNTHRATLSARHRAAKLGFLARASGFFDYSDNDYRIDVEVPDELGRLSPRRVRRFHDAYRAYGFLAQSGFVQRPWAKRLLLSVFLTDFDKDLQHGLHASVARSVPYGEVTYGERTFGATLQYEKSAEHLPELTLSALAGYALRTLTFKDASQLAYDWFGHPYFMRQQPLGERAEFVSDTSTWEHRGFAKLDAGYRLFSGHLLRLNATSNVSKRSGEEHLRQDPTLPDPQAADRDILAVVFGLEYESTWLDEHVVNSLFAKDYVYVASAEVMGPFEPNHTVERKTHTQGAGDALHIRFNDWASSKASYEYATRLPRPDEVFGNSALIVSNLELRPEVSHNANLSLALSSPALRGGSARAEVNGFMRVSERLIALALVPDMPASYQNLRSARALGVETSAGWTSPGNFVEIEATSTWLDLRNTSSSGQYALSRGDRVPNRPWLFATGSARGRLFDLCVANDQLTLTWITRYVHSFFPSWEGAGDRDSKDVVPAQLLHSVSLDYVLRLAAELSVGVELQNLTDSKAFDYLGIQKPGRAFYVKATAKY